MPARSLIIYHELSYGKRESSDCNVYHAALMGWRDICHQPVMNNLFTEIDYFHIGFRQTHIECMGKERTSENKVVLTKIDSAQLTYILPSPHYEGVISVEEALSHRRSHRSYIKDSIPAEDLSQILWAAYGITKPLTGYPQTRGGLNAAPSAGALYPLELYALIGNVNDIEPGVFKYVPEEHKIIRNISKDIKRELSIAAQNREMISIAPACLFYSAVFSITTQKYGDRGRKRYVCMDLGHSAQNVYLQAEALHLGTCAIGEFDDVEVREVMQLPEEEEPLYIMPIGKYYNKYEY